MKRRSATPTRIEILSFAGCPHREATLERVLDVVGALGVEADVRGVEVRDAEDAARLGFPGSPTVRIDGIDLEPEAELRALDALSCRMYGGSGVPSRDLLTKAIVAAVGWAAGVSGH